MAMPESSEAIELYSPEMRAALLLENAVDAADYLLARSAVRALGIDPDDIEHQPPLSAQPGE